MSALAIISRFFHIRSLLRSQPVSLIEALPEVPQVLLVAHDLPAVEENISLADYVPTGVAGDDEGVPLTVVATISDLHHVPARTEGLAGAGLVSNRSLQFGDWHFFEDSTGSTAAPPLAGGLIWKSR